MLFENPVDRQIPRVFRTTSVHAPPPTIRFLYTLNVVAHTFLQIKEEMDMLWTSVLLVPLKDVFVI